MYAIPSIQLDDDFHVFGLGRPATIPSKEDFYRVIINNTVTTAYLNLA